MTPIAVFKDFDLLPDEADVDLAGRAAFDLSAFLGARSGTDREVRVHLDVPDGGVDVVVPVVAFGFLVQVLDQLALGNTVTVAPYTAEVTTQQAADLLNVSRPFLIGLLTSGEIGYRMVGTHRRIRAEDLLAYKRSDDSRRRRSADELTGLSQDLDLYRTRGAAWPSGMGAPSALSSP